MPDAFGRISHMFMVKMDSFPRSILDTGSCVSVRSLLDEFLHFPHVHELSRWRAESGCSRILAAFFALRPHGRECPFFSALDDEEFFIVEGSGWPGSPESDSQVTCHPN